MISMTLRHEGDLEGTARNDFYHLIQRKLKSNCHNNILYCHNLNCFLGVNLLESIIKQREMNDFVRLSLEDESAAVGIRPRSRVEVTGPPSVLLRNHLIARSELWRRCSEIGRWLVRNDIQVIRWGRRRRCCGEALDEG